MAAVNVIARNRAQVFIMRVLIDPIADFLPADLIIEFSYLLFYLRFNCNNNVFDYNKIVIRNLRIENRE
jgi:hypothetical protein